MHPSSNVSISLFTKSSFLPLKDKSPLLSSIFNSDLDKLFIASYDNLLIFINI